MAVALALLRRFTHAQRQAIAAQPRHFLTGRLDLSVFARLAALRRIT